MSDHLIPQSLISQYGFRDLTPIFELTKQTWPKCLQADFRNIYMQRKNYNISFRILLLHRQVPQFKLPCPMWKSRREGKHMTVTYSVYCFGASQQHHDNKTKPKKSNILKCLSIDCPRDLTYVIKQTIMFISYLFEAFTVSPPASIFVVLTTPPVREILLHITNGFSAIPAPSDKIFINYYAHLTMIRLERLVTSATAT